MKHTIQEKNWREELDKIEKEYPMAIYNWSPEDWKTHIEKIIASKLQSILSEVKELSTKDLAYDSDDFDNGLSRMKSDVQSIISNRMGEK